MNGNMMYCTKCGTQIEMSSLHCRKCGARQAPLAVPAKSGGVSGWVIAGIIGIVLVMVVGILAAIAIPQFAAYRIKAYDAAAQADIRNARTSMEAYYVDNAKYPDTLDQAGFHAAPGVDIRLEKRPDGNWSLAASHAQGRKVYIMDSTNADVREELKH